MKDENYQQQSPAVVEDKATEELKKRAKDLGLIVNADAGGDEGTIESQTETTQKLNGSVKRVADGEMAGKKKGGERCDQ